MAVTYQNNSLAVVGANATSITISVPTGFSVGNLLIACVSKDGSGPITLPTGWTLIQAGGSSFYNYFSVSYRVAEAGDTSWTWTGANEQWAGAILRYTGQDTTTPIHASDKDTGNNTTPTAPSVSYTSLLTGSLALQCFGADDDDTPYSTPAQLTERYNHVSNTGIGTCGSAGGDKTISGTGSTGTAAFTMNASETWAAVTVVIAATTSGQELYDTVSKVIVATPTSIKSIDFKKTLTISETSVLIKFIKFQRTLDTSGTMIPTELFKFLNTFSISGVHSPSISPLSFGVAKSFSSSITPTLSDIALYYLTQSVQASIVPLTLLKLFITKTLTTSEVPTVGDIYTLVSLISATINNLPGVECKFKLNFSTSGTIIPSASSISGKYDTVSFSIQTTPTLSKVLDYSPTITLGITIESFIEALQTLVSEKSFSGIETPTIDIKDLIGVSFTETSNFTYLLKTFLSQSLSQTNTPTVSKVLSYKKTLDTSMTSSLTIDKILNIVSSLPLSTAQNTEVLSKFFLDLSSSMTGVPSTNTKFLLNILFTEQSILTKSLKFILIKLLTGTLESTIDITVSYKDSILLTLSGIPSAITDEFIPKLILLLEDSKIENIILSDNQLKELILTDAKTKGLTLEDA